VLFRSPRPMVVMPHGGPHGVHDSWGFNADAQFLASRGYAVLQVNYRGSGGRGRGFLTSGYREWGGKMQDDIADGVRWAIAQKLADPERICTYGASYGGYAAMMQPIRYPDLYKCAIGYVGVYDLEVFRQEGDITDRESGRRYIDRVIGSDPESPRARATASTSRRTSPSSTAGWKRSSRSTSAPARRRKAQANAACNSARSSRCVRAALASSQAKLASSM